MEQWIFKNVPQEKPPLQVLAEDQGEERWHRIEKRVINSPPYLMTLLETSVL